MEKKRQDQEFKYVNMNSRQHIVLLDLAKFSHNILKYSFSEIVNVSGVIIDKNHEYLEIICGVINKKNQPAALMYNTKAKLQET